MIRTIWSDAEPLDSAIQAGINDFCLFAKMDPEET